MKKFFIIFAILSTMIPSAFAIDYGFKEENYQAPRRELSIIISKDGYFPNKITVFQGEEVRFFVTNTTRNESCFILKEENIFLASKLGRISEGTAVFDQVGKFQFYCPTGNIAGTINVLERPSDKMKREIASMKEKKAVHYWLPREE